MDTSTNTHPTKVLHPFTSTFDRVIEDQT
jgi:hypothetical protein